MVDAKAAERAKRFILVVEGNIDDRFAVSMLLQQFGCTICSAHSSAEAVEFLTVAPPAAIVAEDGQPGADLIARIRKDGRFSEIPLILLVNPRDHAAGRVPQDAAAAVLRKPVNPEELYRAVQTAVEKTPRRNIRITTYLPATLTDGPGGDGFVTVLSEYGMFFRTLEPRTVHEKIPLSITIKERSVLIEATVLYTCAFDEGPFKEPGMGLKFSKISDDSRVYIRSYILEQIDTGISRSGG